MAAIVRIKRRRGEEPVESLKFSCKRRKEDDDKSSTDVSGVLKFAGTVSVQDTNISSHIREAIKKDKLQKEYKNHSLTHENWTVRQRQRQKRQSQTNRYKVIASKREPHLDKLDTVEESEVERTEDKQTRNGISDKAKENGDNTNSNPQASVSNVDNSAMPEKVFCLYDVEHEDVRNTSNNSTSTSEYSNITCNSEPMVRERVPVNNQSNSDYVYDLYYTNSREIDFRVLEDMLYVEAFGDDVEFVDSRAGEDEYLEVYDDDDDSNDEGNWRNDYPEEDPHFIENHNEEYCYGDDDVGHHRYDTEDPLSAFMAASCNIQSTEPESPVEDDGICQVISSPQRSYESYHRAMLHDLGEEPDDSDDDFDVR